MINPAAIEALEEIVGRAYLKSGDDLGALNPGWHPDNLKAGVMVAPASTAEIAAVVALCAQHGIGLVPHGGRTGLVGGAISRPSEIIVSTARLNRIVDLDPVARTAVVEAGVTLEALQVAARVHGLEPGIDVPSRGSATIGGMVSTNAGGILAFRNGVMRHQVLGLEAVLSDGSVFSDLTRVVKNTAGYDLKHLFIGSEGTLGVVTRVVLKLEVVPAAHATALFGLPSVTAVLDLIRMGLDSPAGSLRAAEVLWQQFFSLTAAASGFTDTSLVPDTPVYLLMALAGSDEAAMRAAFETIYAQAAERYPEITGVVAASARQERDLWRLREDTDAIYRAFPAAPSYDVSVPVSVIDVYIEDVLRGLAGVDPTLKPFVFGHLADGNLHVVLNRAGPLDPQFSRCVEAALYNPLRAMGGSLSAEHGIGSKRTEALRRYADPISLALMERIKRSLDPTGALNAGKVVPLPNGQESAA